MLNTIKRKVSKETAKIDYYMTNGTFDLLAEESKKIRMTSDGVLEFSFENGDVIGLKMNSKCLYDNGKISYIELCYIKGLYEIDESIDIRQKKCEIL